MNPMEREVRFSHAIYGVLVPGRDEGFYLFEECHDAEDFADAVRNIGGVAELSEELLYDHLDMKELVDAEAVAGSGRLSLFQAEGLHPGRSGVAQAADDLTRSIGSAHVPSV